MGQIDAARLRATLHVAETVEGGAVKFTFDGARLSIAVAPGFTLSPGGEFAVSESMEAVPPPRRRLEPSRPAAPAPAVADWREADPAPEPAAPAEDSAMASAGIIFVALGVLLLCISVFMPLNAEGWNVINLPRAVLAICLHVSGWGFSLLGTLLLLHSKRHP